MNESKIEDVGSVVVKVNIYKDMNFILNTYSRSQGLEHTHSFTHSFMFDFILSYLNEINLISEQIT